VQAGDGLELSWSDVSPAQDSLRYRIRRESLDSRYSWDSEEVSWDDPTPALLSLEALEVESSRVRLIWYGRDAGNLEAEVERHEETTDWAVLGPATALGPDRLEFLDASIQENRRYAYRLTWTEDGSVQATPATWVETPPLLRLSLEGLVPNPAVGAAKVALTLVDSSPAVLEVIDVSGRRVFRRDVGFLGPGKHSIPVLTASKARPGIYVIRLSCGPETLVVRGAVLR
jgi:hypothetical protein